MAVEIYEEDKPTGGERCVDCVHWELDPKALDSRQKYILAVRSRSVTDVSSKYLDILKTYGKCKVQYLDRDYTWKSYDMGTQGNWQCTALDSEGVMLFDEIQIDES